MAQNTNILELNGKQYDALSGRLLDGVVKPPAHKAGVDGMLRTSRATTAAAPRPAAAHHAEPAGQTLSPVTSRPVMDIAHTPRRASGSSTTAHRPQPSQTLMRHAVQKPKPGLKRYVKAQTRTDVLAKQPAFTIAPKLSFTNVSPQRLEHAKRIARSQLIRKFAPDSLAPTPKATPAAHHAAPHPATPTHGAARGSAATPHHQASHAKPTMDIFEQALAAATSHENQPVKLKKHGLRSKRTSNKGTGHRLLNLGAATFAVVLLLGFIAYQNQANIAVRVASARAGFHVSLPGYHPSGFAFGGVHYSPGTAAVSFHSNSDDRNFTLIQKVSNWDSQTLASDFVANASDSYQAYEAGGRTVYLYGNGKATWVNNGVWYQLSGSSDLTDTQILRVAAST